MRTLEERIEVADGVTLHVELDGEGADAPLVLLNGAFCTGRQWDVVLPNLLAAGFRTIRIDSRGIGTSSRGPAADLRFEVFADDIAAVCAALGAKQTVVWGTAWGARVALVTAARHPDLVGRLVLSDLGIDPADTVAQKAGAAEAKEARRLAGIEEVPNPEGLGVHADEQAARDAVGATRLHHDLMPFVTAVRAPTLIATGEFDPNLASSRRALSGLADGRLTVIEKAGHAALLQRPQLVVESVLPFLTQADLAAGDSA